MTSHVTVKEFVSQICISSTPDFSVIECVVLDAEGKKWLCFMKNHWVPNRCGGKSGIEGQLYGFTEAPDTDK